MKTSVRAGICEFGTLPMGPQQNSGTATGYWYLAKGLQSLFAKSRIQKVEVGPISAEAFLKEFVDSTETFFLNF